MEKQELSASVSGHLMDAHAVFPEEELSLGGKWRFFRQEIGQPLPDGWNTLEFNDKKWERISVPGVWTSDERLAAGLYRKTFILSREQGSRQVILRFESVLPEANLCVNGVPVGQISGHSGPVEFDITNLIHPDKNLIALMMHHVKGHRSTGIPGDVSLYSLPARAITRLETATQWQEDGIPLLRVSLDARDAEGFTARIALMDENTVVGYCESEVSNGNAEAELPCPDVELWCSGHPKLYRVAVILWDGIAMYHTRELTVGFRRIERKDSTVRINGQPEKLFAVEFQPFDPEEGCFRSAGQMEQDLMLLRTHHLNGIMLTSPAPDTLYALCDRMGVYVLDRSGSDGTTETAQEQNRRLAQTFGCHPSIVAWNISSDHPGILFMDQLSVIHDPSAEQLRMLAGPVEGEVISDSPKKRKFHRGLESSGQPIPLLLSFSRVPGGMDQIIPGLRNKGNFFAMVFPSLHGALLRADGTASPLLRELRVLLQPIAFSYTDGNLTVTNLSLLRSTAGYQCRYLLTRDGETIVNRNLELEVGPGETKSLFLETQYDIFKAGRYHLTVGFVHPGTGASIASAQWEVAHLPHVFDENPGGTIREDQGSFLLRSLESAYTVSRSTGGLDQITLGDRPMLTAPARLIFAAEAERSIGFLHSGEWEKGTFSRKKPRPSVQEVDHMTRVVSATYKLGSGLIQNLMLYSDGSVGCELRLRTGRTAPSLLGMCLPLDRDLNRFSWFGLGPDDATSEHQAGRFFSIHNQDDSSSGGCKEPVYHLTVTDSTGFGLLIRSDEGLRASFKTGDQENQLRLELACPELKPHTTYTFAFTIQPLSE